MDSINKYQELYYKTDNSKEYQVKGNQFDNGVKLNVLNSTTDKFYDDEVGVYSFRSRINRQGINKDMDIKALNNMLKNPEANKKKLADISAYYYISNGDVFQLYDLARVLSTLDTKIQCVNRDDEKYDKNIKSVSNGLRKINHKELTRDMITQLISNGTVCGIWLGDRKTGLYPLIFDDLQYIFPAYRVKGKWAVWFDLSYLSKFSDVERQAYLEDLSPYVTETDYKMYIADSTQCRYIEFPIERSICVRTHTLYRNQRFGIPWSTQAIQDLMHKKKLKDLEKSVANKIINATAVLTIGDKENPNLKLGKDRKTKVFGGVKKALSENEENGGISVVSVPEWAGLKFQEVGKEPLDPDKFESVNNDVQNGLGYAKGLITGNEGNYASNNLSLQIFYMKIGEILENIESEVYNKYINLLLVDKYKDSYYLEYDKSMPLDKKTRLTQLYQLETQGYTIKPMLEIMGIDYLEYIEQSKYEIKNLKLRNEITPPSSSFTQSGKNNQSGSPTDETNLNDNTVQSKEVDANNQPKANK